MTPLEETVEAFDTLVRQGKVRYVGCSNFSGWHLMKALATADRMGAQRYVSQQINYSLEAREAEYELIPAGIDQGVGVLVWSPLAGGLLSGKYRSDGDRPAALAPGSGLARPGHRGLGPACGGSSTSSSRSRLRAAFRPRAWRSRGCSPARASPR